MANKCDEKLGVYVLKMSENDAKNTRFLIKWKNKLNIDDVNMNILHSNSIKHPEHLFSELIINYKTIYLNTYNVIVLDISHEGQQNIIFRHESTQIWESECYGFLLSRNKDFIKLNLHGMNVLSLGS